MVVVRQNAGERLSMRGYRMSLRTYSTWRGGMGAWIKVGSIGDVGVGKARCVRVGGRKVVIFNEDGRLHAYNDYCTHVGGPLSQGSYENGIVTCLWHGAQFRVVDGEPIPPPAGG